MAREMRCGACGGTNLRTCTNGSWTGNYGHRINLKLRETPMPAKKETPTSAKKIVVIATMVVKYVRLLRRPNARLWTWLQDCNTISQCPCCVEYINNRRCWGCPAKVRGAKCYAQPWSAELQQIADELSGSSDTRAKQLSLFRASAPRVRKLLKDRLWYWVGKTQMDIK